MDFSKNSLRMRLHNIRPFIVPITELIDIPVVAEISDLPAGCPGNRHCPNSCSSDFSDSLNSIKGLLPILPVTDIKKGVVFDSFDIRQSCHHKQMASAEIGFPNPL